MKKLKIHILILCFTYISVSSQNEANNWYFGNHAGISFVAGGNTIPILDSEIYTFEGCSSYSDSSGNLLFYTDGITIWNKNNQPMPNGFGLEGNPSSTQSGLIVPNPDDDNLFYLFTVGTIATPVGLPPNPGFKYYIVDMNADSGFGDIISGPVNLSNGQDDNWSERVTSVQNTDCDGFWVISLAESVFYSYLVTNTGVATTPIISNLSSVIPITDVDLEIFQDRRGYLKASPGGAKLACAMQGSGMFLLDFDASTGVVSNGKELELEDENDESYGVEFSLNGRMLYVSTGIAGSQGSGVQGSTEANLFQFEITSNNINDINDSRNLIYTYNNSRGALQLAPNGKIYWASDLNPFLSVINNPDSATNVNFDFLSVDLGGNNSFEGLPPFLQSLFVANLDLVNDGTGILATQLDLCHGETWTLESLDPDIPVNALYEWSLDGVSLGLPNTTTFLPIDEFGTYGAGFYELDVDYQDGSCKHRGIALVTFRDDPNLEPTSTLVQCDDDSDGFSLVDLNDANESILNDDLTDQLFTYYTSLPNAQTQTDPLSDTFDITQFNTDNVTLWVRVENRFGCSSIAQLVVEIQTPTISSFNQILRACDDFRDVNGFNNADNDDTDGITFFDFTNPDNDPSTPDSIVDSVLTLFPVIDRPNLVVHFYHEINDALFEENEILNITNYRNNFDANDAFNERIYIRVTDNTGTSCPGFGLDFYIDLEVIPIPKILLSDDDLEFNGCDDDNDGLFDFDTSQLEFNLLGGSQTDVVLTYFFQDGSPVDSSNPGNFPNPFSTSTQTIIIEATNNRLSDCKEVFAINFIVDVLPIANIVPQQIICDNGVDDQDNIASFDTSLIQETVLGGENTQTNMIVTYHDHFLNLLPSPLPNPFETKSQIIRVTVENPDNSLCSVTTTIDFIVNDTPNFDIDDVILCANNDPIEVTLNIENPEGIYDYNWFQIINGINEVVGSNNDSLIVTTEGEYEVTATSTDGNFCQQTQNFTVIASNEAVLDNILTTDTTFSNSSSIIIELTGIGDYEYALDIVDINDDDEYQDSNSFNFVSFGLHTITLRDKNGCGIITEEFVILEYQKFFTPNDDGDFETWNLTNTSSLFTTFNTVSNITIFDRYGKIMAEVDPKGNGWDGKYKGKQVVATDYWFSVNLIDFNGKIFIKKGHFSLRL